jgi:uncharacterized Tic20 family protein
MRKRGRGALDVVTTVIAAVLRIAALLIVLGIIFVVLEANSDNSIVSFVLDVADFLVGPFDGLFTPKDEKLEVAINYGIAAVIYLVVASLVARLGAR